MGFNNKVGAANDPSRGSVFDPESAAANSIDAVGSVFESDAHTRGPEGPVGPQGPAGPTGARGEMGLAGRGIATITAVPANPADGESIMVTITYSDGSNPETFTVPAGVPGAAGNAANVFAMSGATGDPTERPDGNLLVDGDIWIRTDLDPHVLYTYDLATSVWDRVSAEVTAANVDNLAIRPESVLIGGTNGDFLLQERQAAVVVGASLAPQATSSYTKDAARVTILLATAPSGLAAGQDLYLQVDANPNDSEIPVGGYLADYTIEVVNARTEHRFSNIRPVDGTTMITGDVLDLSAGTISGFIFEVFADMSRGVFVLEDTADGVDIFRVEVDNDVIDFAHTPTVNGRPISGLGLDYVTSSNIPPQGRDIVENQTYTMRVTNRTTADLPAATGVRVSGIRPDGPTLDFTRGVVAGGTEYFLVSFDSTNILNLRNVQLVRIQIIFGSGANETIVDILDDVGSTASDTHYEFTSGTGGTFTVTPSDTRIGQTVSVGVADSIIQYIYFRVTFNSDGSIAEVLEASTRLNQEIDPGETTFTDLPANMPHTHFAVQNLSNDRYFSDGTDTSFDLSTTAKAHFDGDIIRGDIDYTLLPSEGGGHVIEDSDGNDEPQRAHLQFTGAGVSVMDNETDDRTIITIPGGAAPHPHPEQLTISAATTEFEQGTTNVQRVNVTVSELGFSPNLTSAVFSASTSDVVIEQPTSVSGASATGVAVISDVTKNSARTFTVSALVSGTGGGVTYSNERRTVTMHVSPNWYADVLATEPTAASSGTSQGIFRVGDLVQLTGVAGSSIYIWLPTAFIDSNLLITTRNPTVGYDIGSVLRADGAFSLYSLGETTAGRTYTIRIGEL